MADGDQDEEQDDPWAQGADDAQNAAIDDEEAEEEQIWQAMRLSLQDQGGPADGLQQVLLPSTPGCRRSSQGRLR